MRKRKQLFHKLLASILSLALVLTGVIPQGMSSVQAAAGDQEDGLILYYDFNLQNSFSTVISDASGNENAGQLKRIGGAPEGNYSIDDVNIYGKQVKALNLPGGEDGTYLQMPNGILKDCNAVTISMWVKLTTDAGYQRIWDFGSNTTSYMYLLSDGWNEGFEGYASAITTEGWSQEKGVSKGEGNNIDKNRWVLTTVVMDGTNMSLYENGQQIGETVNTGISVKDLGATTQNYIACGQFTGSNDNNPTKGQFAEVKIYNKALTAEEIAAMYYVDDAGIVTADNGDLDLGDTSEVTEDIELPTKGINGSDIAWTSQNAAIEIQTENGGTIGKVTRPAQGQGNATGTLTAAISKGTANATKTFDVTVLAEYTDQQRVDRDAADLRKNMGDLSAVTADIILPATGNLGSVIRWESENSAIVIENNVAKVTRPAIGADNASGKLTAAVSYNDATATVELDVTVLAFREAVTIETVEEINVTTLKGKSPSLPNYVKVTYTDKSTGREKAVWPATIDNSKYSAVGTFTVEGSIVDAKPAKKITANVTVVDEEEAVKTIVSDTFDLSDITLDKIGDNGSILTQNRDRDIAYLKLLDNKRMLYNFYKTFGQEEKIKDVEPLGGWDEPSGLLRGHSTGHYMSALALAYASTGDEEINNKLKEMVHELRELQKMSQGDAKAFTSAGVNQSLWSTDPTEWGDGFISAYSPDQFALLEKYTPYAQIWAPYYTLHKLIAGFLDAYTYTGNPEALAAAKALGKWTYNRLSGCTQEQLTKMWDMYIAGEFGGFNESMAQLYIYAKADGDTDADIYLDGAKLFDNKTFFDKLAANEDGKLVDEATGEDILLGIQGRHANQHIPQIIGAMETYEATVAKGSPDMYYYDVAENFWQMVVSRYAYSTGGVGTGEKFTDPYEQANNISGNENCETCAAYNMLKLTKMLNNYNPDNAEYMDYYERTLYNQILASQTPNVEENAENPDWSIHNGTTYMLPIGPGSTRSFGDDYNSFTCCHGTGMENHVKYQEAAYAKTGNSLYVGLYLPTTLTWEDKGVKVVQETEFPSEVTKLTVSALEGKTAQSFDMKLRVPYWATNGFTVKKNGTKVNVNAETSTYVTLEGVQAGDVIDIEMPWTLHLDKTPDKIGNSTVASVMYGPFVMAAKNSSKDWITLKLSANLPDSIQTGTNTTNGFPTLSSNGYSFAPMFAPEYATSAYHAYFKIYTVSDDGNYFDVTVDNYTPEKGSITVDEVVKEDNDLVITAQPKSGYAVQMLVVNGQKVQVGEDNTYTVPTVKGDVSIVGSFCSANPPEVDPQHLEFTAAVTSDYTASWENLGGIKTDWEPTVSANSGGNSWGNWPQEAGSEHYVQYMWDSEVTMNRFDIFWYDDGGGTRIPASMKIMYIAEDGTWKEAEMISRFEDILEIDQYNTVHLKEITTIAVRLVLTVRDDTAANGICRWKVSKNVPATAEEKASIKTAIDAAIETVGAENTKFTADSWSNLQAAIANAQELQSSEYATKADIDAAITAVEQAIDDLKLANPPTEDDETALKNAISDAAKVAAAENESKYTADSWKNLQTALDKAKKVYDNKLATKEEVTAATEAVEQAIKNLVEKEQPVVRPGTPTSVKAAWTGTKSIKITWKKVSGAEKYIVYRSYKKSSGYKQIATATKNSYVDKKSTAGKTAYYKVVAAKGSTVSSYSNVASAYKLKAPLKLKAKAKKSTVTITFGKVAKANGYEIYCSTKKNSKFKKVATIKKAKTTKKAFKKMKKGTYYFKVRAYKTSGKKKIYTGYSKTVSVKVK